MADVALNLVVIRSSNLDRARDFYQVLGLSFDRHRHGSGPEHLGSELGAAVFEIYPRMGEADATISTRIGFPVASVDSVVDDLETADFAVISRPKESPWGRRAVVTDPDGHRVELLENEADDDCGR